MGKLLQRQNQIKNYRTLHFFDIRPTHPVHLLLRNSLRYHWNLVLGCQIYTCSYELLFCKRFHQNWNSVNEGVRLCRLYFRLLERSQCNLLYTEYYNSSCRIYRMGRLSNSLFICCCINIHCFHQRVLHHARQRWLSLVYCSVEVNH